MDEVRVIAHIHTDFKDKFGIPRQSGLAPSLKGCIEFEKEFRSPDFIKGIEQFSHLWILFRFDGVKSQDGTVHATVRPPRLGGNENVGVFASRSPFRPNPIGLSNVKLEKVEMSANGPLLWVSGIDLLDGTAIYDIKPYLAYVDSHEDALDGFAGLHKDENLKVVFSDELLRLIPEDKRAGLLEALSQDPRPHYHDDESRVYGLSYAGFNVKFMVCKDTLTVNAVEGER